MNESPVAAVALSVTAVPSGYEAVHPEAEASVLDAARFCEKLGHEVDEASPAFDAHRVNRAFVTLWGAGALAAITYWSRAAGREPEERDFEPDTWAVAEIGRRRTAADLAQGLTAMNELVAAFDAFFEQHDVWLTPATGEPPPPLGTMAPAADNPLAGFTRSGAFTPFTAAVNVAGLPAMSVPLHWDEDGLPIGTQLIGPPAGEALLLRVAAQLEEARPWAARRPALA